VRANDRDSAARLTATIGADHAQAALCRIAEENLRGHSRSDSFKLGAPQLNQSANHISPSAPLISKHFGLRLSLAAAQFNCALYLFTEHVRLSFGEFSCIVVGQQIAGPGRWPDGKQFRHSHGSLSMCGQLSHGEAGAVSGTVESRE